MKIVLALLAVVTCGATYGWAAGPLDSKTFKCEDKSASSLQAWGGARGKCITQCAQKQVKDPSRVCVGALDATTQACVDKARDKAVNTAVKSCPLGLAACGGYEPSCDSGHCSTLAAPTCTVAGDCTQDTPHDYSTKQVATQAGAIDGAAYAFQCALRGGTCNGSNHCTNDTSMSCTTAADCPPNNLKDKCGPAVISALAKFTLSLGKCFGKCNSKALVKGDPTYQCIPDQPTACTNDSQCAPVGGHCDTAGTHKCDPVAPLDSLTKTCISNAAAAAIASQNKKCVPGAPACLGGASFNAAPGLAIVTGALIPAQGDPAKAQYCVP